jgi:hypothetical protein
MFWSVETRTVVNKMCVPDVGADATRQSRCHTKSYQNAGAQQTGTNSLRMSGAGAGDQQLSARLNLVPPLEQLTSDAT